MANKVEIFLSSSDISKEIAQFDDVQDALESTAKRKAKAGDALLAAHRKTGAHSVKYEGHNSTVQFGHIDHYVVLDGPAPISVEFGHHAENGRWVQGLYILTRAMFM